MPLSGNSVALWVLGQLANVNSLPPTDGGQTERVNRVLGGLLRHYVSPVQDDWDQYLSCTTCADFAINNAEHKSTGASPFMLNYGFSPRIPYSVKDGPRVVLLMNLSRACSGVLWRPGLCIGLLQALILEVRNAKSSLPILGVLLSDSRKMIGCF